MQILLLKYGVEHNDNCNVPLNYVLTTSNTEKKKLGLWLSEQRTYFEPHMLPQYRKVHLQELVGKQNLFWDVGEASRKQKEAKWKKWYDYLMAYGEEHGRDCNVPNSFVVTLFDQTKVRLGQWLSNQHLLYVTNKLPQNRRYNLQKLVDQGKLRWEDNDSLLFKVDEAK